MPTISAEDRRIDKAGRSHTSLVLEGLKGKVVALLDAHICNENVVGSHALNRYLHASILIMPCTGGLGRVRCWDLQRQHMNQCCSTKLTIGVLGQL